MSAERNTRGVIVNKDETIRCVYCANRIQSYAVKMGDFVYYHFTCYNLDRKAAK